MNFSKYVQQWKSLKSVKLKKLIHVVYQEMFRIFLSMHDVLLLFSTLDYENLL